MKLAPHQRTTVRNQTPATGAIHPRLPFNPVFTPPVG